MPFKISGLRMNDTVSLKTQYSQPEYFARIYMNLQNG